MHRLLVWPIDPVTMIFQPQIDVTSSIYEVIPYIKFKTLGSFVFSYATDKQTDSKILSTPWIIAAFRQRVPYACCKGDVDYMQECESHWQSFW